MAAAGKRDGASGNRDATQLLAEDLNNVLKSSKIPIVILGEDLHIARFTPSAALALTLTRDDVGRPFSVIAQKLRVPSLEKQARQALAGRSALEEVMAPDHRWYSLRMRPYRTEKHEVKGVVIALMDMDPLRATLARLEESQRLGEELNRIQAAISSSFSIDKTLAKTIERGAKALGADSAILLAPDEDEWIVEFVYNLSPDLLGERVGREEAQHAGAAEISRSPLAVERAGRDPRLHPAYVERHEIKSLLAVALKAKGDFFGTLCFHYSSFAVSFNPSQLSFVTQLGVSLALGLLNAQLLGASKEELARTKLLQEIALAATLSPDLNSTMAEVLKTLHKRLRMSAGHISVLERNKKVLSLLAAHGYPGELEAQIEHIDMGTHASLAVRAVRDGRLLTHDDDSSTHQRSAKMDLANSRYLASPIYYREEPVGVLFLVFPARRAFTSDEMEVAATVGLVVGQAIENARLFDAHLMAEQEVRNELTISNLLLSASESLAAPIALSEVLDSLAEVLIRITGRTRVVISMLAERTDELVVLACCGWQATPRGTRRTVGELASAARKAIRGKQARVVDLESRGTPEELKKQAEKNRARVLLSVPIVLRGEVVGTVDIDEPGERREFTRREIRVAEGIASQAAIAMKNAKLYEESLAKAKSLETVSQLGTLITSTLRMDDALEQILDYSSVLLDAPSSVLMLFDKDQNVFQVAARDGISKRTSKKTLPLACVKRLSLDSPTATFVKNLADYPQLPLFAAMANEGFVSGIVSAMYIDAEIYGLLMIQDKRELDPSQEDLGAFRLFANQAATALKNARMYEEERRIAETLQQSLTQPVPHVHGLEIGIVYKSAFQAEQVGGDFYDVFELEDDLVAILVGDISGKGIKAAGLTETIRSSVRTLAYIDPSPAFVLSRLNQSLMRQFKPSTFATAVFCVVDVSNGNLRIGVAGHPYPVLYCEEECRLIRSPSDALLGAFEERYTESSMRLEEGQMLLFYTDGLTEARSGSSMFGDRRLLRAISSQEPESPQALVEGLLRAATEFSRERLSDDIALLALRLKRD